MPTKNRSKDTTSRGFETKEPNWYPLRRLSLVSFQAPTDRVWAPNPNRKEPNEDLIKQLLACGCESLAAKLVLDAADALALEESDSQTPSQENVGLIKGFSLRSAQIARSVGHKRREVKAHVIQAMWNEDPREGRLLTLGDSLALAEHHLEDPLLDGMSLAVAVSHVASRLDEARPFQSQKCEIENVIRSAGLSGWSEKNMKNYWLKRAPRRCRDIITKAMDW